MPRKSRKGPVSSLGDVSIHDYANSAAPINRGKKPSTNVNIVLKQEIEKAWDEKNDSDFEGELVIERNEDGTSSSVIKKPSPRRKTRTSGSCHREEKGRKSYPLDIWFLLSEYIRPEDVGVFSAICKSSYEVTCSAKFWFYLYRRYYRCVPDMPASLQPEKLVRKTALRKDVIRALFYMYQPFHNRNIKNHPSVLIHHTLCEMSSIKKNKKEYGYYFKMRPTKLSSSRRSTPGAPTLWEVLDDVFYNPDEHCCALNVVCHQLIPMPPVIGLTLRFTSLTLTQSLNSYKLQLDFGPMYGMRGGAEFTTVILEPVVQVLVVDWWHHLYPFNRNHMLDLTDSLNWSLAHYQ